MVALVFTFALSAGLGFLAIAGDSSALGNALGRLNMNVPSVSFNHEQRIALGVFSLLALAVWLLVAFGLFYPGF